MQPNYNSQTSTYGGQLKFAATASFPFTVTIPLYISTVDIPIRKPKFTQVNTVPAPDDVGYSDWSTHVLIQGGQGVLSSALAGFFLNPYTIVTDSAGVKYWQYNLTTDGTQGGPSIGITGLSYGELIWWYLEGRLNNSSPSRFIRTDPSSYTDPFGNVYNYVTIQQFECDYTPVLHKQTFNMTLYLEM